MKDAPFVSTTNACKLCKPLGAAIAFKGIEGCVPFLHGSQGCATYMRRYVISHFREPVDIASSSLGEKHAVYGGGPNLKLGLLNVMQKYGAGAIGVASTCLTETIGDDMNMILREFRDEFDKECGGELELPPIVHVSTPSYEGTHMEGFHAAVRAMVDQLAEAPESGGKSGPLAVLPGLVSPEDLRNLKDILERFGLPATVLPDYSETLDGPALEDYQKLPEGGTPVAAIRALGGARAALQMSRCQKDGLLAGHVLSEKFGVECVRIGLPVGLRETDALFETLEKLAGCGVPERYEKERGRLVDAMVDAHKYVSGKRAIVYGEEDLAVGLTSLLAEIGVRPVLVATGGEPAHFEQAVADVIGDLCPLPQTRKGVDFYEIVAQAEQLAPDLVLGSSKGYRVLARKLGIPLIRTGFPIHDRFGAQRVEHLFYEGAQALFDRIVNAVIETKQESSPVGFMYV